MKIKRFNELNNEIEKIQENVEEVVPNDEYSKEQPVSQHADVFGLQQVGKKAYSGNNRRRQYFYNYYSGNKIMGRSKYELNDEMFRLAQRDDKIGTIAQFCLQIEREGISHDYDLASMIKKEI